MQDMHAKIVSEAKIMLVDDERLNMEVLMAHLEEEGYANFVMTDNSVDAFELVCKEEPDVLLLDLIMPEVTGFEILAQLRENESTQHLPVVVLTSSDDSKTKLKVLQLGATDFLAKPVDASELALRLRNTLSARQYQDQLLNTDAVTGLPSKKVFDTTLSKVFDRSKEKNQNSALLLLSPIRLKAINDTFGRAAGDALLLTLANRVCSVLSIDRYAGNHAGSEFDFFNKQMFRLRGDAFAIIIPAFRDQEEIIDIGEELIASLDQPYLVDKQDVFLNSSMGISISLQDADNHDVWFSHSESALFESKQNSGSGYLFYSSEMDESARQYIQIESALRSALPSKQLFLVYQPKVDVQTGYIVGAEALIRWNHPEFGIVSPDLFISLAEKSGQIVEIGAWVMEEACKQSMQWRASGEKDFKIAVNVSIRQLADPGFVTTVSEIIEDSGIDASALQLELTENMIMDNPESNVVILNELKSLGLSLSIDDFGTGYSSLSYLQKFPIDELKIDRSFISEITSPLTKAPIVKAVVSLGHDLDLKLVAEGVETIHQLARLKALKCQVYQGYFCSPPIDAAEFGTMLKKLGQTSQEKMKKAG